MTKVTNIQNKDELLNLSTQLSDEITVLQAEIDSIQTKLGTVTNYDGMNFAGVASLISGNLDNVLSALQTLSGNVNSYVTELNEFDQYEEPVPDEELTAPELVAPEETTPGTEPDEEENPEEETEPETTTEPEEENEETPEDETEETPTSRPTVPVSPTTPDNGDNSEETPSNPESETPSEPSQSENPNEPEPETPSNPTQPSNPTPTQPSNPTPTQPSNPTPSEPVFEPEQLTASEEIITGVGDPSVDVSNYTNNAELGYAVTTGNTSFELGDKDYELLCAIIAAESDGSYDNTLAIASAVLNRCENSEYKNLYGMDPIAQITASNQFEGYTSGEFKQYVGNTSDIVMQAVKDALAGVRNHTSCTLSN